MRRGLFAIAALAALSMSADAARAQPAPVNPAPILSAPPAASGVVPPKLSGDALKAARVHELIMDLSVDEATKELESVDATDPILSLERALLALYKGDCTESAEILAQPSLAEIEPAQRMLAIARGCELTTAGAVTRTDDASGAWIRFQDDADTVLAPFLNEVVKSARAVFEKDLGVTMPKMIRIEVVRDQMGLSAMTGLPLTAARTTGTIGIAKWGRVVIVSPRATENGYPVMDTLAHELTHLALTRGSRDRAPLWLQEGIARREEAKWRPSSPFDEVPSADDLAAFGIKKNIGPEIDRIGPSIALLPSAEEAQITYAKVQSFMGFYIREAGDRALPSLLEGLKGQSLGSDDLDAVMRSLSGSSFGTWAARWKSTLLTEAHELPDVDKPGAPQPKGLKEVRQRYRLGELLLDRKHAGAAARELDRAHTVLPSEAPVRALLARSLLDAGEKDRAKTLVERTEDVHHNEARWWSMRAALGVPDIEVALRLAIAMAPYDPAIVCEEKAAPALPEDGARRALCEAARRKPRGR